MKQFLEILEKKFYRGLFIHGDAIGQLAAGFSSRSTTQSTLNSFHSSGVELCTGIKRSRMLTELMTTKTTLLCVSPLDKMLARNVNAMHQVSARMVNRSYKDLLSKRSHMSLRTRLLTTEHKLQFEEEYNSSTYFYMVGYFDIMALRISQLSSIDIVQKIIDETTLHVSIQPFNSIDVNNFVNDAEAVSLIVLKFLKTQYPTREDVQSQIFNHLLPIQFPLKACPAAKLPVKKNKSI